jgi:hypothetical protein
VSRPITVMRTIPQAAEGYTRYDLSNGWFIAKEALVHRRCHGHLYEAWEPGAGPVSTANKHGARGAAYRGGGESLASLLALFNRMHT